MALLLITSVVESTLGRAWVGGFSSRGKARLPKLQSVRTGHPPDTILKSMMGPPFPRSFLIFPRSSGIILDLLASSSISPRSLDLPRLSSSFLVLSSLAISDQFSRECSFVIPPRSLSHAGCHYLSRHIQGCSHTRHTP